MMEKRTIIAIILTFIIIVAWGAIQSKYFPQEPSKPETKEAVRKKENTPCGEEGRKGSSRGQGREASSGNEISAEERGLG